MTTPSKRWPNHAEWAREDCLTLARKGRQALIDALEHTDNPVMLRNLARAIEAFREIESKLMAVGPREDAKC